MCKFSSKSGGVPFQISFFLGDLTRNDPRSLMGEITTHIKRWFQNYRNDKYVLGLNSDNQVHLLKFLFVELLEYV